jgi:hypothetical protein
LRYRASQPTSELPVNRHAACPDRETGMTGEICPEFEQSFGRQAVHLVCLNRVKYPASLALLTVKCESGSLN